MNSEKGASLVSLIIGAIVIIFLIAISIYMISDNGLINQVSAQNENINMQGNYTKYDENGTLLEANEATFSEKGYSKEINKVLDSLFISTTDEDIGLNDISSIANFLNCELVTNEKSDVIYEGSIYKISATKKTDDLVSKVEIRSLIDERVSGSIETTLDGSKKLNYAQ